MNVRVRLFAILRDRAGADAFALELAPGATVASAAQAVAHRYPKVEPLLSGTAFAVNQAYVADTTVLRDGDELALIPPVSGG